MNHNIDQDIDQTITEALEHLNWTVSTFEAKFLQLEELVDAVRENIESIKPVSLDGFKDRLTALSAQVFIGSAILGPVDEGKAMNILRTVEEAEHLAQLLSIRTELLSITESM